MDIVDLLLVSATCSMIMVLMLAIRKFIGLYVGAWWRTIIWGMIMLRLCIPVMIDSPFSMYPSEWKQAFTQTSISDETNQIPGSGDAAMPQKEMESVPQDQAPPEDPGLADIPSDRSYEAFDWLNLIGYIYLSGLIVSLILCIAKYRKLNQWIYTLSRCGDKRVHDILNRVKKDMHIKKRVWVYMDQAIPVPALTGILSPRILLSPGAVHDISDQHIEIILRHELAHLKRRDPLKLMCIELIACLHWFNPVLHLCKRAIRHDIELACDETLLRRFPADEIIEYSRVLAVFSSEDMKHTPYFVMANLQGKDGRRLKERLIMIRNYKRKRNRVLGTIMSLCLVLILVACTTLEVDAILPDSTHDGSANEPVSADIDTNDNVDMVETRVDSDLLEIYLVGETAEGIDPWDNKNLDALDPAGEPLMTSEQFMGYYSKCDREHCPDPADYGEIIPGEGTDHGDLYYDLNGSCGELFYGNFKNAGGEDGKQYGVLLMSKGEKLLCAIFDTGSELPTPQNAQIGLSAYKDGITLWGAYGECNFSGMMAGALPEDLYFSAEELKENYDQLAQSGSLSDILTAASTISLYSGLRDEIVFTAEETDDIAGLMARAQYSGRSFELSEEQRQQRGSSVMTLTFAYEDGAVDLSLYEDMKTVSINPHRDKQWVFLDEAYFNAPELCSYIDDLSQDDMPKLYELTNITEIKVIENGEIGKSIDNTTVLGEIEEYLLACKRTSMNNLHGSAYEIIIIADGMEYTMRPDDNVKEALLFDGHQYQVPVALLQLLDVY